MSQDKKMSQDIPVPELPSSSDGLKKKTLMPGLQLSSPHFIIAALLRCGDWDDGKTLNCLTFWRQLMILLNIGKVLMPPWFDGH